jgi:excisionase family DNA binding protein
MEEPVLSHLKSSKRKAGTPRLPIDKHATLPDAALKPAAALRLTTSPARLGAGRALRVVPNIAGEHPSAKQPAQLPSPPPTQHFNLSEERLLTVKEAAFRLGKSPFTIRTWLHSGLLRGWQPGGLHCSLMVSEASVEEVLILPVGYRCRSEKR